jgi:hypothetical protein
MIKHGLLCRLRVFENRILRGISVSKRDVNGEWRRSTMRNFIVCVVVLSLGD